MTYFIHPCVEPDRHPRAWRALDCGSCCYRSPRCLRHRYSYDCLPGELSSCVPPHPCPQSFLFSATLLGDPSKSFPFTDWHPVMAVEKGSSVPYFETRSMTTPCPGTVAV